MKTDAMPADDRVWLPHGQNVWCRPNGYGVRAIRREAQCPASAQCRR